MAYCIIPVITEKQHCNSGANNQKLKFQPQEQGWRRKTLIMKLFSVVMTIPIMSENRMQGKKFGQYSTTYYQG